MKYLFVLLLSLVISIMVYGQVLSGNVVDEETNEPVSFANVFFANTSIGTTTEVNGGFVLQGFNPGKYMLVISFVGYERKTLNLEIGEGESINALIKLKQSLVELSDVEVHADVSDRTRNLKMFKYFFLGATTNSEKCQIANMEKIHLFYDSETNKLFAHAKEPVEIWNYALGYQISYLLLDFQVDLEKGEFSIQGIPRFFEISTEKRSQQRRWDKERQKAYRGSPLHFFRSLRDSALKANDFEINKLFKYPNTEREPDIIIDERIKHFKELVRLNPNSKDSYDSLHHWKVQKRKPVILDSLGDKITGGEVMSDLGIVKFKGYLQVLYHGGKESIKYARANHRTYSRNYQESQVHFTKNELRVYENGYYEEARSVFWEGYWSWSSNLAEMLPLDYEPNN